MPLAEPIWMSEPAWRAIRDAVVAPGGAAELKAAWEKPQHDGNRIAVFLTPADATQLAALLDADPQLAQLLATET